MLGGSAFFICQISAKSLFSQVLGAKLVFWGLVFVLGFSNFEKSTEIHSENSSLVKSLFKARALYLYWGKAPLFAEFSDCQKKTWVKKKLGLKKFDLGLTKKVRLS
jgi:hypothetical protein